MLRTMQLTGAVILFGSLLVPGCSEVASPGGDSGPDTWQDASARDLARDLRAGDLRSGDRAVDGAADAGGLAALVAAAISAGCGASALAGLASATPAAVRQEVIDLDRASKVKTWTPGYSFNQPIKVTLKVPPIQGYSWTYTLYVPATYKGDPTSPFPLWVQPAHPTDPFATKKAYAGGRLESYSATSGHKFLFVRINFANLIQKHFPYPASIPALSQPYGMEYERDMAAVLDAAIADVKRRFFVDSGKVYVSGVSASGASSWVHGIMSADQYAAIHPVSIIPTDYHGDMYLNLSSTGVYVWQGDADTTTPISKVDPMITKIKGYGLKLFYYVNKGGGHGGFSYTADLTSIMPILLKSYSRAVNPETVHRGILNPRGNQAFWLAAKKYRSPLNPKASKLAAPPAVVDAAWKGNVVTITQAKGISELELRWLSGGAGPARGKAGDKLSVLLDGKQLGPFTLVEDPTVALEDYCRYGDINRLWAGRVKVAIP